MFWLVWLPVSLTLLAMTLTWRAGWGPRLAFLAPGAAGVFMLALWILHKRKIEGNAAVQLRTVEALAAAIAARRYQPHDHLQRVRTYAVELGRRMKLTGTDLAALEAAALLHRVGELAVPEQMGFRGGVPNRDSSDALKLTPVVSAALLEDVRFPFPVAPIVRSQRERWNGSGYPDGLSGEEIPLGARILAAVEELITMTEGETPMTLSQAMKRVDAQSGRAFDPQVVEALQEHYEEIEKLATNGGAASAQPINGNASDGRGHGPAYLSTISAARMESETLFEISNDLGNSLNLDETLSALSVRLKRLVPYHSVAAYILRDEQLVPEYVSGENFRLFASVRIPLGEGISGWVAQFRRPIINGNPSLEPGYPLDANRFTVLRSALSIPLEGLQGVVGVLTFYHADSDAYTADHLRVLRTVSAKISLSVENALAFQRAESSATTDYLTDLPNARALFLHLDRELARCKRLNSSVAVMVCDLDGFKQINDRFGHLEGNRILRLFARGLLDSCREYDYVARMGGDEFVVVAPGLIDTAARARGASLNGLAMAAGREVCNEELLSASVGYAIFPRDGNDAERLLAEADRRMYIDKQRHEAARSSTQTAATA